MLAVRTPLVILAWSTNAYHPSDLALLLPRIAFTNHYHREEGQGIEPNAPVRVGQYTQHRGRGCWHGSMVKGGRGYTQLEWWYTIKSGTHHGGRYRKDFSEKIFFGRIAFYEHGGKTGRAMVKYPLYKKNAQRKKHPRIPRFDNRAV